MNPYKKIAFYTLGCKLNFSETSSISRILGNHSFAKVDFYDSPDIYVINTCSVTNNADKECRLIVRRALKHNPDAFIAVIGCYAQLKPGEIGSMEGVDLVLGATEKFNLPEYISNLEKKGKAEVYAAEIKNAKEFYPSFSAGDRTRSFLKVQDGCDYFCSFCTIPLARGASRSASISETLEVARKAISTGVKEIVLTGVNIGDFGRISPNQKSKNLQPEEGILLLLSQLDKLAFDGRFRISSIEPNLLSDEIVELVAGSKRIAPHFHIPLQSGSDKILKLMRRKYDTGLYLSRIEKIKSLMPHCCIGADVIVGFPGETEEDFFTTYNFLTGLDLSYLHVFTYSERDNTIAVKMEEAVDAGVRIRRNKMLQILSEKKKRMFYEQNSGKILTMLPEHGNAVDTEAGEFMYGFTENYIKLRTELRADLINRFQKVKISKIDSDGIARGELVSEL